MLQRSEECLQVDVEEIPGRLKPLQALEPCTLPDFLMQEGRTCVEIEDGLNLQNLSIIVQFTAPA